MINQDQSMTWDMPHVARRSLHMVLPRSKQLAVLKFSCLMCRSGKHDVHELTVKVCMPILLAVFSFPSCSEERKLLASSGTTDMWFHLWDRHCSLVILLTRGSPEATTKSLLRSVTCCTAHIAPLRRWVRNVPGIMLFPLQTGNPEKYGVPACPHDDVLLT